jgi:hypothetical protein
MRFCELRHVVRVGFQIQAVLRVQTKHQTVAVNAVRAEHAACSDFAKIGEYLVQIR